MLISYLRTIGIATMQGMDEIDIILEQQWNKIQKSEKVLICSLDLEENTFLLESEDILKDNLRKMLPGITDGNKLNFSPFVKIYHPIIQKGKKFSSIDPKLVVKFAKISGFEKIENQNLLTAKFGNWLKENASLLQKKIHSHFELNFLTKNNKDKIIVMKNAPLYLAFKLMTSYGYKSIGDIPEYEEAYLHRKKSGQENKRITCVPPVSICLACGEEKSELLSLQACEYFDLFSLNQASFQLQFQGETNSLQALICYDCEKSVRKGYNEVNTTLKFFAYKREVTQKKSHFIYHSLIPLYEKPSNLSNFITKIIDVRKEHFMKKNNSFARKLSELNEALDKADKSRTKSIRKQIEITEKIQRETEEKGIIEGSNDISYLTLLQEVKSRNVGIVDLFYREKLEKDKIVKVIEDILYGKGSRISMIVEWLEIVGKRHRDTKFNIGKLMLTFGEKTGRQILQSLYSAKRIKLRIISEAAYKNLWNNFRKSLIVPEKNKKQYIFLVQDGIKQFHYVIDLLNEANLLR